jgi:hypothetical protein
MTNITKERVLRDVLNHSKSSQTSFHIENAHSRVSGVQNKEDTEAIEEHLEHWIGKDIIEQRKHGVYWVPHNKRDKAQEILDEEKYDDLTIERN